MSDFQTFVLALVACIGALIALHLVAFFLNHDPAWVIAKTALFGTLWLFIKGAK